MRKKTETDEPNAVECFTERAEFYASQGEFPKASAVLRRALEQESVLSNKERAGLHLRLADYLYHQFLIGDALIQYRICLDIGVGLSKSELLTRIATCYTRLEDHKSALEYHKKALRQPDQQWRGDCHVRMAGTLSDLTDYKNAIKHFQKGRIGARSRFFDWEIDHGTGIAYLKQGNFQLAIDHFDSALKSRLVDIPGNVYCFMGDAYLHKGKGELDKAEHYYKLTSQDEQLDTSANGYAKLASLYEKKRQWFDAMVAYSQAEQKYAEAEVRGIVYTPYVRNKLQKVRERLAALRRDRILECYKTGGECPHCDTEPPKQYVFVAMPFGQNDRQKASFISIVDNGIRPAINDVDLAYLRADTKPHNKDIMCHICLLIQKSRFVVADLTGKNPNVFYEVGMAHAREKQVILIANSKGCLPLPFDVRDLKCILYTSEADLREKLAQSLTELMRTREDSFARL